MTGFPFLSNIILPLTVTEPDQKFVKLPQRLVADSSSAVLR